MRKQILLLGFLLLTATNLVAQTLTVTLTPSDYNGVNISCFGGQNGSLTVNVTGGTPPYTYEWSNDAADATITSLAAGYYAVRVIDSDVLTDDAFAEITLTQPEPLQMEEMIPYVYSNGFNVSAFGSCNGNITTNINGGTLPYSYRWEPGQQTALSPTNLCANENVLIVTDINGCETNQGIGLSEPQRDDWTMSGNWGSNPATQFIGTLDNKDLSFKTYNAERVRIKANGEIKINSLEGQGDRPVTVDNDGILRIPAPNAPCGVSPAVPSWATSVNTSNFLLYTCPLTTRVGIGTSVYKNKLDVSGNTAIGVSFAGIQNAPANGLAVEGSVGIGTFSPTAKFHVVGNSVFSQTTSSITSAAQITGNNGYSSASTPDFTWAGNTITGMFHPNVHVIGFSTAGFENMRMIYDAFQGHTKVIIPAGISTLNTNTTYSYGLYVGRGVLTEKVKVAINTTGDWSDKVFASDYKLMSLQSIKSFIIKNKHLPNIPSAEEVVNSGLDLGEMDAKLLEKIEELTLHVIRLEEEITKLKSNKNEK
jgi:SprB repeat